MGQGPPVTTKDTRTSPNLQAGAVSTSAADLVWARSSMQGRRLAMEDADCIEIGLLGPEKHLFGVFDGHGGRKVAEYAQKYLPAIVKHSVASSDGEPEEAELLDAFYKQVLTKSILLLDQLIESPAGVNYLDVLVETGKLPDVSELEKQDPSVARYEDGSTAIVCLMIGMKLFVANVGDSRCVLCRSSTNFNLSRDHDLTIEEEKKRALVDGCWRKNMHLMINNPWFDDQPTGVNMTRALGDFCFKQHPEKKPEEHPVTALPEVRSEEIVDQTDEFLVLACDGLFESGTWETVTEFIRSELLAGNALDSVVEKTLDRFMKTDNMTLQIILLPTKACEKLIKSGMAVLQADKDFDFRMAEIKARRAAEIEPEKPPKLRSMQSSPKRNRTQTTKKTKKTKLKTQAQRTEPEPTSVFDVCIQEQ